MKTHNDLLIEFNGSNRIPYSKLLETKEWDDKRNDVVKRDGNQCVSCHNRTTQYVPEINKHVWFTDFSLVKVLSDDFWKSWDYFKEIDGEKFTGIIATEGDYVYKEDYEHPEPVLVDKHYHLQVHHKHYVIGKLPWDYKDEALVTLCNWCHFDLHQRTIVPVYSDINDNLFEQTIVPCKKCNGAGFIPKFNHVEDGICFQCNGSRFTVK